MSYSKNLDKRLREARKAKKAVGPVPPHPHKYPTHPGLKGSVHGGVCNRTACGEGNATWFNIATRGYYCRSCAQGINWRPPAILCIEVDRNLTHEEMDQLYADRAEKGW